MVVVEFDNVFIVFGDKFVSVLLMMDKGCDRVEV